MEHTRSRRNRFILSALTLAAANVVVWSFIVGAGSVPARIAFLEVGQGDSGLVEFPNGGAAVQLLVDGGPPNGAALRELGKLLPPHDRYLDLVVMTHPQEDHFGGLIELARRYDIGAFLWSGREGTTDSYRELMQTLEDRGVRKIVVGAGDRITIGNGKIAVLAPTSELLSARDLNETSVVLKIVFEGVRALFTGDAGKEAETVLIRAHAGPVDILKVGHHGSRFSSSEQFLAALEPALAVIQVGKNSYGHPTRDALERLLRIGATVFRTDERGTIEIHPVGGAVRISSVR